MSRTKESMMTYKEAKEEAAFEALEATLSAANRQVGRPEVSHYTQGTIEPIDYINNHEFNFNLGCVIKYVTRCDHKGSKVQDLLKAIDYINFELESSK